jgi:hypothetical protein
MEKKVAWLRERVLFIGTQFSNLYTAVDTPARGRVGSFEVNLKCIVHESTTVLRGSSRERKLLARVRRAMAFE